MRSCGVLLALLVATASCSSVKGRLVPDVIVEDGKGEKVRLRSYIGTVTVISFWATWCGPCQQELPELARLERELGDGVQVVLISDEERAVIDGFLGQRSIALSSLRDPSYDAFRAFGVSSIPSSFVLDKRGIVRSRTVGYYDGQYAVMKRQVQDLAGS